MVEHTLSCHLGDYEVEYPNFQLEGLEDVIMIPTQLVEKKLLHWTPLFYAVALNSSLDIFRFILERSLNDLDFKDEISNDIVYYLTYWGREKMIDLYRRITEPQNMNNTMFLIKKVQGYLLPINSNLYLIDQDIYYKNLNFKETIDVHFSSIYHKSDTSFYGYSDKDTLFLYDLDKKNLLEIEKDNNLDKIYYNQGKFYKKHFLSSEMIIFDPETQKIEKMKLNFFGFFPIQDYIIILNFNKGKEMMINIKSSKFNIEKEFGKVIGEKMRRNIAGSATNLIIIRDRYIIMNIYSNLFCFQFNENMIEELDLKFSFKNQERYSYKIIKISDETILFSIKDEIILCDLVIHPKSLELKVNAQFKIHTICWENIYKILYHDSLDRLLIYDHKYTFIYQLKHKEDHLSIKNHDLYFKFQ